MSHRIRINPTGKSFEVASDGETLLDAGLRAGLNVPYNCGNGTCGGCRMRVVSGEVDEVPHDFHFTDSERAAGWVLPCRAYVRSDLEIEVRLMGSAADVPYQEIVAKVAKVERLQPDVVQLAVRTPRSQTLSFLAGQRVALRFNGQPERQLAIASCPCDGMHLRFHLRRADDPFAAFVFDNVERGARVVLAGPTGQFLLHDESPRKRLFVCWESGFAAVASLIDHAIALDPERTMHLYWLSAIPQGHYLSNYCRAWVDALDDFHYHSVDLRPAGEIALEAAFDDIARGRQDLIDYDVYAALPGAALDFARALFLTQGLPPSQWRGEVVPRP
jgi:CDP-4-dehydro-6-deoxyglucose reductase